MYGIGDDAAAPQKVVAAEPRRPRGNPFARCKPRTEQRVALAARQNHDPCPQPDAIVKVDHILLGYADAARRNGVANVFRLSDAVNPVKRVLVALEKVRRPRARTTTGVPSLARL